MYCHRESMPCALLCVCVTINTTLHFSTQRYSHGDTTESSCACRHDVLHFVLISPSFTDHVARGWASRVRVTIALCRRRPLPVPDKENQHHTTRPSPRYTFWLRHKHSLEDRSSGYQIASTPVKLAFRPSWWPGTLLSFYIHIILHIIKK